MKLVSPLVSVTARKPSGVGMIVVTVLVVEVVFVAVLVLVVVESTVMVVETISVDVKPPLPVHGTYELQTIVVVGPDDGFVTVEIGVNV